jgi:excisionase family DNA binding protein
MAQTTRNRLLSTAEAASYCGSTKSTFEKLRVLGGSAAYIKLGRKVVYDPADLDAWLTEKRRRSTSDTSAAEAA